MAPTGVSLLWSYPRFAALEICCHARGCTLRFLHRWLRVSDECTALGPRLADLTLSLFSALFFCILPALLCLGRLRSAGSPRLWVPLRRHQNATVNLLLSWSSPKALRRVRTDGARQGHALVSFRGRGVSPVPPNFTPPRYSLAPLRSIPMSTSSTQGCSNGVMCHEFCRQVKPLFIS
jgi:hypothetical protein